MARNKSGLIPMLIVFGLEHTLVPFWIDIQVVPPFYESSSREVVDSNDKGVPYYEPVPRILKRIHEEKIKIAIASNNNFPNATHQLLTLFGWHKYINFEEVFVEDKVLHFERLRQRSKTPYFDMLYFDDNSTSILQISELGVCGIAIGTEGMKDYYLDYGLKIFARRKINETEDHISCRSIPLIVNKKKYGW